MGPTPNKISRHTRHGNRNSNFSIRVFRNPKNAVLLDKRSVKPETPGPIYIHQFHQFVPARLPFRPVRKAKGHPRSMQSYRTGKSGHTRTHDKHRLVIGGNIFHPETDSGCPRLFKSPKDQFLGF